MANALVTGAAGFIGYHLCLRLVAQGVEVQGVDNLNDYYSVDLKRDRLKRLEESANFRFSLCELADRPAVGRLFDSGDYDTVYHLAAQPGVRYSLENPHAYADSNLVAFLNVLEGCRHHGRPPLVYASSSSVYGGNTKSPFSIEDRVDDPVSLYAATKRANELIAHTYAPLYGMAITGLRFFTVYGPWGRPDMAIYKFTDRMLRGEAIDVYNNGRMKRDFTYVDDIAEGVRLAAEKSIERRTLGEDADGAHRVYNLGNNRPVELGRVIALLEEALGVVAEKNYLPMQPGDVVETCADIDATQHDLGYAPATPLEVGIERFVAWRKSYSPAVV